MVLGPLKRTRTCGDALALLHQQRPGSVDSNAYASLLRQCGEERWLEGGKQVHAHIASSGQAEKRFLGNLLVYMYGKCGALEAAFQVFDGIRMRNEFSWSIMIAAFTQNGHLVEANLAFHKMPSRNAVSWNSLLAASSSVESLDSAERLFKQMPCQDVVSWTTMVVAYAEAGDCRRALEMFRLMLQQGQRPDEVTCVTVLDACSRLACIKDCRSVHCIAAECGFFYSGFKVGNAVVNMYGKAGSLVEAKSWFDAMPMKNCVTWTSMISAYSQNGWNREALGVYDRMMMLGDKLELDALAFVSVLDACASMLDVEKGVSVHKAILSRRFQSNTKLGTGLVHMYGKFGMLDQAREAFEAMEYRDVVAWTALLSMYVQQLQPKQAIQVFKLMDLEGVAPNEITIVSVLDACSKLSDGRAIHRSLSDEMLTPLAATALVSMYANCGSLVEASKVFNKHSCSERVTLWNAMVVAYDKNGQAEKSVEVFRGMQLQGLIPTGISFMCVLSACSHGGMLKLGRGHFLSMVGDYGITPGMDHYGCLVDLIGRSGRVEDAEELVNGMPFEPDDGAWRSLLAAAKLQGRQSVAQRAARGVHELDPRGASAFSILSNMYATTVKCTVDPPSIGKGNATVDLLAFGQ